MDLQIFAIYDYKTETFQNIFTVQHEGHAERMFADVARDEDTLIGRHPKDFALVRLGRVDTNTGIIYAEEPAPKFFNSAYQYLTKDVEKYTSNEDE